MPQNEILGDLQLEFSLAPEEAEELPLEELGSSPFDCNSYSLFAV